jgi:hypothetical protein
MDAIAPPASTPSASETKTPDSLLPGVLLGPAAFLWLWALPIGVLLLLNAQAFWLIEGNLSVDQRHDALLLGAGNALNLLAGLAIFAFGKYRRPVAGIATFETQPWWGVPALVTQVGYLWWTVAWTEHVLPASVTTWIYPTERHLFNQFAFAMLPLFLGILRLAGTRSPKNLGTALAINFGAAVGGPVLLYMLALVIRTFPGFNEATGIVFASAMVVFGVLMFFGVVRVLLLGLRNLRRWHAAGERAAIILFAAVLPICGLLLNRMIPFPVDFQAWEIYALVVANASILLFASVQHARCPQLSFHLLCGTFPFSLYFFIVFLPYTPLSILAVIVMGTGFLVLAPIFLFILHLYALHRSHRDLVSAASRLRVMLTGLVCFLLLPAFFTARGLADKTALNAALDYVYSPTLTTEKLRYPANLTNLRRALNSHRSYKNGIYYPLLSDFYAWLVFDNLVLPDDKLDRLETTFFGAVGSRLNQSLLRDGLSPWSRHRGVRDRTRMPQARPTPRTVDVSQLDLKTSSTSGGDTVTTFTLTLQNRGEAPAEFVQKLPLPSGVLVNGFRLHINGQPVPGRLFEKKTALWVYTMIRDSERRDPGLLFYNTRDELELRVFPVNGNARVVVEIDFLHPAATSIGVASTPANDPTAELAKLGLSFRPRVSHAAGEFAVTGLNPKDFSATRREPYLHLLVDRSRENGFTGDLSATINVLREKFPGAHLGRITLANYDVVDLVPTLIPLEELARTVTAESLRNLPASGGLALDLALARAIRQHGDLDLDRLVGGDGPPPVPVFVILSGKAAPRVLDFPLTDTWRDLLPHLEIAELGANGSFLWHVHSADSADENAAPLFRVGGSTRPLSTRQALRFPQPVTSPVALTVWSPQNSTWQPVQAVTVQADDTPWSQAVALQLRAQDEGRNPGGTRLPRKALVQASRDTGILLPSTSYIVVENSAQWRMLELSERQKLDQNAALDFRETPAPPAWWLVGGLALWLGGRRFRQGRPLSLRRGARSSCPGKMVKPPI